MPTEICSTVDKTVVKFYNSLQGDIMQKKIIVTNAMDNRKIEYVLSGDLALSGNIIKKLKMSGGILLNGECVHIDKRLTAGDELVLNFPKEQPGNILPENIPLEILYEDEDILAVNKPPLMITHPVGEKYSGTLANGVMFYLNSQVPFRVITRLDKETSGVVLIAKNALSAQKLNEAMQKGEIKKEYVAVVRGVPCESSGVIDAPIKRADGIKRSVDKNGKKAVTEYYVEKSVGGNSLVTLNPLTGRTHQIRVHLAYMGTPIYGDWLYGKEDDGRVRLHCRKIEFCHPQKNEKIAIEAPIPEDITSLVK